MSRVLITGATGGLGAAIIRELTAAAHEPSWCDEMYVMKMGREVNFNVPEAVTSELKLRATVPFDHIIHCAGAEVVSPLRLTSDEQYRKAMMCADSAFAILRAAASKGVMADGGSIVLMSSVAAHRGSAGMVAYSAGKAAIEGMVRAAAVELALRRIRVNAVAAGAFRSPMHDRITARMPQPSQDAYAAAHPLGFGSVEAVARAVLSLLEEQWTTGTVRVVDGGYLA